MFAKILLVSLIAAITVAVAARRSDGAGAEQHYRVRLHDTLWSIASSHYGGDPRDGIWRIERRNHLSSALIRPGQVLVLP